MDLDPRQRAAAQVSSGSLLTPATAPMQPTDGPSTSAVPTLAADPALAAEPPPDDTPMLPAVPLLVPPDFPDNAVSSAIFFFFFLGYREDVHSMQAARPTKIPDEPLLCETPALSR